jgi:hypothetical protein
VSQESPKKKKPAIFTVYSNDHLIFVVRDLCVCCGLGTCGVTYCSGLNVYCLTDDDHNYVISLTVIFRFFIPVVFYANEGGWVRQNTNVVGSCLLVR